MGLPPTFDEELLQQVARITVAARDRQVQEARS
jgi:hypothetical protein